MEKIGYKIIEINAKAGTKVMRDINRIDEFEKIVKMSDITLVNEFAGIDKVNNAIDNYKAYFDNRDLDKNCKANQCIIYINEKIIEEDFKVISIGKDFVKDIESTPDFIHIRGKLNGISKYVNFISLRIHTLQDWSIRKKQFEEIRNYLTNIYKENEIYIVAGDHNCGHMTIKCFNCIPNCSSCNNDYEEHDARKLHSICNIKKEYENLGFSFIFNKEHGTMFNSFLANYDFFAVKGIKSSELNIYKKGIYLFDHIPIGINIMFDEA